MRGLTVVPTAVIQATHNVRGTQQGLKLEPEFPKPETWRHGTPMCVHGGAKKKTSATCIFWNFRTEWLKIRRDDAAADRA